MEGRQLREEDGKAEERETAGENGERKRRDEDMGHDGDQTLGRRQRDARKG